MKTPTRDERAARRHSNRVGGSSWIFMEKAFLAGVRYARQQDVQAVKKCITIGHYRDQAVAAIKGSSKK